MAVHIDAEGRGMRRKMSCQRAALLTTLAATSLVQAAPAAADDDAYLLEVEHRYTMMTAQQLLAAGHRACSIVDSGEPASSATDMLSRELGVGVSIAFGIVSNAIIHLGC
jgi:hypothetical protein